MRKKSKYKPRPVLADPVTWVVRGVKKLDEVAFSETMTLDIKNGSAFLELQQGRGTGSDVKTLIFAFNMAEALARLGVEQPELPASHAAQEAIVSMLQRCHGIGNGRFVTTGPELQAIRDALAVHDDQLRKSSVVKMEEALRLVGEIHASGTMRKILL